VVLACTGITFAVVYRSTGAQLREQIDSELSGDAASLEHNLATSRSRSPQAVAQVAAHYVDGQPFAASSTVLFAVVPGAGTSTNQPELFAGNAPDSDDTPADHVREQVLARQLLGSHSGYSTLAAPDLGSLRVLTRRVR